MALPLKKESYTFADCLTWPENERIELIDGEAVMMSLPSTVHQKISGELFRQLANFLEGKKCEVFSAAVPWEITFLSDTFHIHDRQSSCSGFLRCLRSKRL